MNLRELTRKVARNVGINLPAVQLFGKQVGTESITPEMMLSMLSKSIVTLVMPTLH